MSLPRSIPVALVEEGARMAGICNACRYCEGFCAVFPALERRLSFAEGDLAYLANLCHDCGSCYHACQYAPPHEFQLNFPKMLADIRLQTYRKYAWPDPLSALFQRNGITVALIAAASLALLLWAIVLRRPCWRGSRLGAVVFYPVLSHRSMAAFGPLHCRVLASVVVIAPRAFPARNCDFSARSRSPIRWPMRCGYATRRRRRAAYPDGRPRTRDVSSIT
jgi:citrate/tricarballylate utilization protein